MNTQQKTVGMLIPSFLPNLGGIEVGLHNIALRVSKLGWTPIVFAPQEHVKELKEKNWKLPYKVVPLPPRIWGICTRMPSIGLKIMDIYLGYMNRKYNIDFWHVTMGFPTGCAIVHYAENKKDTVPYLIRCAGEDIQKKQEIGYGLRLNPNLDKVISEYISKSQLLISITSSVYDEYKMLNVPDERIINIPNGVAIDRFEKEIDKDGVRTRLGVKKDDILIISVGRNHPKKNYRSLIKAGQHLQDMGLRKFKIVCIGRGCKDLLGQVTELGLSENIILIDGMSTPNEKNILLPVDELVEAYKAADIFAFPSLMETFGIAIVEAMAAKLPVIVGNSEGCRDVVENGKWGIMCNPNDPKDLALKILSIIKDENLKEELVQKSTKRAKDFDWNKIAEMYVEIYEKAQYNNTNATLNKGLT